MSEVFGSTTFVRKISAVENTKNAHTQDCIDGTFHQLAGGKV
jgi:hypothetical protein